MNKVIDVSKWNGKIDWGKVKAAGIYGVIIRAGYGCLISQKDPTFETYYSGAKAAGLHIGTYWYSYAKTKEGAETEASVFKEAIKGKTFDLPVYMDIEDKTQIPLGINTCSDMVKAFCKSMESSGYFAGVYSFDSFFSTNLTKEIQDIYSCWVARVENINPTKCTKFGMHQYSWKGSIPGIIGDVDLSYCYLDFPTVIKNAGLNGYSTAKKYKITAVIDGVDAAKANQITDSCQKMGMKVTTEPLK